MYTGVTYVTILDLVHDVLVYFYTSTRLQLIYNRFNKCQNLTTFIIVLSRGYLCTSWYGRRFIIIYIVQRCQRFVFNKSTLINQSVKKIINDHFNK